MGQIERAWLHHVLQQIHHPIALVGNDNVFLWCNHAYERLVGYSSAELQNMTWMEITADDDVGGDLAGAKSIVDGEVESYTTAKKYRHKDGEHIPVALTVWRYPPGTAQMIGFSVEAIPENTSAQLEKIHAQHKQQIDEIIGRLDAIDARRKMVAEIGNKIIKWSPIIALVGSAIGWLLHWLTS